VSYKERLELRVRHRPRDREFRPVQIEADPDDFDELLKYVEDVARDQDGRYGAGWLHEYEARVVGIDRAWRDFHITGRDR
jgi:hypothetical protein